MEPVISFLGHMSCHLMAALFLSTVVYAVFRSWKAVVICFVASFYTDIDHLFEYFLAKGWQFDWKSMVTGEYFVIVDKRYVFLHSYESILIALGLVLLKKIKGSSAVAYSVGLLGHLMVDQFSYPLKPLAYSLIYRWMHNFNPEGFGS